MNLQSAIDELVAERDRIQAAIDALIKIQSPASPGWKPLHLGTTAPRRKGKGPAVKRPAGKGRGPRKSKLAGQEAKQA